MNDTRTKCINCNGDCEAGCNYCPACDSHLIVSINKPSFLLKPLVTDEILQIISIGIRPDKVYEAKMLLGPMVDLTSIKVTVKNKNLRVSVRRPFNEIFTNLLPTFEKSLRHDIIKIITNYRENFLIPKEIDGQKIRAIVDNKRRTLLLAAPAINDGKVKDKYREILEYNEQI